MQLLFCQIFQKYIHERDNGRLHDENVLFSQYKQYGDDEPSVYDVFVLLAV